MVSNVVDESITYDEFVAAARDFIKVSDKINDGWKLLEDDRSLNKCYLRKECFFLHNGDVLLKSEYVVFYNLSYRVPGFSFNVWNSLGQLLSLEEIRNTVLLDIAERDFYSIVTQQEHPILFRPFFIVHPCETATLIAIFKTASTNLIISYLSLITQLVKFNLPMEYGERHKPLL